MQNEIVQIAKAFKRKEFKKKNISQEDIIDKLL